MYTLLFAEDHFPRGGPASQRLRREEPAEDAADSRSHPYGDVTTISPAISSEEKATLTFKQVPCQRGEIQGFVFLKLNVYFEIIVGEIIVKSPCRLFIVGEIITMVVIT